MLSAFFKFFSLLENVYLKNYRRYNWQIFRAVKVLTAVLISISVYGRLFAAAACCTIFIVYFSVWALRWEPLCTDANITRRSAGYSEWGDIRVLSRAIPRHHLHHQDQTADCVLLLQPDSSLCAHRLHGSPGIYPPARLRRETLIRWAKLAGMSDIWRAILEELMVHIH